MREAADGAAEAAEDALAAGERLFRRPWTFLKSLPALEFLPDADRAEVAFAGRSNVGKSSLLNAVIGQGSLARTSNTPGRTQELVYFQSEARLYLVDMPGYGYAKAPKSQVEAWTRLVKDYLRGRPTLKRVFLLIDARHGLKANDADIMGLLDTAGVAYQVVLTKIDKVRAAGIAELVGRTEQALKAHPAALPEVLPTSAEKRIGLEQLRAEIAQFA